jgi:hypothetical protein
MKAAIVFSQAAGICTISLGQTIPAAAGNASGAMVRPIPSREVLSLNQRAAQNPPQLREIQRPRPNVTVAPTPSPAVKQHRQRQRAQRPAPAIGYADALKRQHHDRHDRGWWQSRYPVIVCVTGHGYYYWDAGYWYPAWGYQPDLENYDYDGPIYTYGDLLPDQVIYNVQRALKALGYYSGPLTGSFSSATRSAIAAVQQDNDLDVTGAIDAPTIEVLGLA